jgi:hypothetical protein
VGKRLLTSHVIGRDSWQWQSPHAEDGCAALPQSVIGVIHPRTPSALLALSMEIQLPLPGCAGSSATQVRFAIQPFFLSS